MKICFLILLTSFNAFAATPAASMGLESAIQTYLGESPQLKGQQEQVELADGDRWRRYLPNEPTFKFENSQNDNALKYGLDLDVSFPGRSLAFAKLEAVQARVQRLELGAKRNDLAVTMAQAYMQCATGQALYQVRETALADTESFFQSLKSRRGVTQAEKISSELEARQSRRDLAESRDDLQVKCKKFYAMLESAGGRTTGVQAALDLPDDLPVSTLGTLGSVTAEQARADSTIALSDANYGLAYWAQMPDLKFSYERGRDFDTHDWKTNFGVSFTLPLLFPFDESVKVRRIRSQAIIDKGDAMIKKIAANAEQMDAARDFRRSQSQLKELRARDLPLARALMESSYAAYRAGQIGYAEMVLSRRTWVDLRLKDVELRSVVVKSRLLCFEQCETIEIASKNL